MPSPTPSPSGCCGPRPATPTTPRSTSTGRRRCRRTCGGCSPSGCRSTAPTCGTALSEEQRIELSRHEVASLASVGLWFELILMQMMLRDLYDDEPTGAHMQYALTEVADECRHSTMFGKAIAHLGVPAYGPPPQDPPARTAVQRDGPRAERLRLDPGRRGDARPLAARRDQGRADPAGHPDGLAHPRARGGAAHDLRPRRGAAPDAGTQPAAAALAPGRHRADLLHAGPRAGQPGDLPLRRDRPGRGTAYGARQPALPRDDAVDGGEAARLPARRTTCCPSTRRRSGGPRC